MGIRESFAKFKIALNVAINKKDFHARNTFYSIIDTMMKANTLHCKKWAEHTETIIENVFKGNYAGTNDEARKLMNRLSK